MKDSMIDTTKQTKDRQRHLFRSSVGRKSDKQEVTILVRTGTSGNKDCINIWMEIDQSAHCMSFTSSVNVIH